MSAGLALTQPPSFGDNALSQVGRAIGQAGASVQYGQAQDLKEQEQQSKDAMREAQAAARLQTAEAASARADAAQTRAAMAGQGTAFQLEKLNLAREGQALRERLGASQAYQRYKKTVEDGNRNDALLNPKKPPTPVMSYPDFLKTMGLNNPAVSGNPEDATVPPDADTSGTSLPQANPNDPNRRPGRYMTPKGPMTWTGTGWVP